MKSIKSYTVKIDGNKSKIEYLHQQLSSIQKLSEFVFGMGGAFVGGYFAGHIGTIFGMLIGGVAGLLLTLLFKI